MCKTYKGLNPLMKNNTVSKKYNERLISSSSFTVTNQLFLSMINESRSDEVSRGEAEVTDNIF